MPKGSACTWLEPLMYNNLQQTCINISERRQRCYRRSFAPAVYSQSVWLDKNYLDQPLDIAFWFWTCLIQPIPELLDSLRPEVRVLGQSVISAPYDKPFWEKSNAKKREREREKEQKRRLNRPLFSKHLFLSHQWNSELGRTTMMCWATFSESEKVSELLC